MPMERAPASLIIARGGIRRARKIRGNDDGARRGGGTTTKGYGWRGGKGEAVGYAPEKRWSPSAVGRKRKYWDWFSRTRDRAPGLGTRGECPRRDSFSTLPGPPPPPPPSRCPPPITPSFSSAATSSSSLSFCNLTLVGTDSLLARYTNPPRYNAIHFCPLTPFPRLPLAEVTRGLGIGRKRDRPTERRVNPLTLARQPLSKAVLIIAD